MKNSIITIILVIAGIAILALWGKSAQLTKTDNSNEKINTEIQSSLSANETFYDFGTISMKDGNVSKIFKISNNGTSSISLKSIETSCMCTTAYIINSSSKKGPFGMEGMGSTRTKEKIPAGESRDIKVVYDPNFHGPAGVGFIDRFIKITDNNNKSIVLEINTTVRP